MVKQYFWVAKVGDVAPGTGKHVTVGDESDCALLCTEQGEYYATCALCSHQNEPLDQGRLEGREVICRRHHLRFDLKSGVCTNAGGYAIKTFEVKIEGDDIFVGCWVD